MSPLTYHFSCQFRIFSKNHSSLIILKMSGLLLRRLNLKIKALNTVSELILKWINIKNWKFKEFRLGSKFTKHNQNKLILIFFFFFKILQPSIRNLNLLEYQSKKLLDEAGVAIQKFRLIESENKGKVLEDFSKCWQWIINLLKQSSEELHPIVFKNSKFGCLVALKTKIQKS